MFAQLVHLWVCSLRVVSVVVVPAHNGAHDGVGLADDRGVGESAALDNAVGNPRHSGDMVR